MRTVKLNDVIEIFNGYAFDSERFNSTGQGIPVIRIRDIVPGRSETFYSGDYPKEYLIDNGALLVGMDGEFNIEFWRGGKALLNQRICQIIPKDSVDISFIKYRLGILLKRIEDETPFVTVKHLSSEKLKDEVIDLPSLTEQKRIASLLARADRLRQVRRTAHDLGNELLQSVFLAMFGDVIRNDKGWKLMSLGQTCDEIYRYPTFYGFDYVEEGVPVVRIGDILLNGEVNPNLENYVRIAPEINKRFPRTILELGDILMAVRGDGSTGKRIGMVKSKNLVGSNISPNLLRFKAKENCVLSYYLFTFMTSSGGQELIDRYITRTAKKTITSGDIQTIRIPVPPLSLQEEFADVVRRVESLRARMSEAERQVDGLFEALLSEVFND